MIYEQEFNKHKKLLDELKETTKDQIGLVSPARVYVHEAKAIVGNYFQFKELIEAEEFTEEEIMKSPSWKKALKKLNKLEDLLKEKEFSKKTMIVDPPTDFYEILKEDTEFYQSYLNKQKFKINLSGSKEKVYINPTDLSALVSTSLGDSAKWAPENSEININLDSDKDNVYLTIENQCYNKPVNEEIGEKSGIGTKTEEVFTEFVGAKVYKDKINTILNPDYFVKTIVIPKEVKN
ncbi:hypothetical protein HOD29_04485 [archaeon]|jgi:hypothetical protein|nr:hypothetical protein [archaeon]